MVISSAKLRVCVYCLNDENTKTRQTMFFSANVQVNGCQAGSFWWNKLWLVGWVKIA